MKRNAVLLLAIALSTACQEPSTQPDPGASAVTSLVGIYKLVAVNGQPIPTTLGSSSVVGGGLTIFGDAGWTAGDTSHALSQSGAVIGTTLFRWGGKVIETSNPNVYIFRDSALAGIRYTGETNGNVFTLTGSSGVVWRYQR